MARITVFIERNFNIVEPGALEIKNNKGAIIDVVELFLF